MIAKGIPRDRKNESDALGTSHRVLKHIGSGVGRCGAGCIDDEVCCDEDDDEDDIPGWRQPTSYLSALFRRMVQAR
jgi:hypothetical protein